MKRGALGRPLGRLAGTAPALAGVLLAEFVDATAGVDDLLFARIERVAVRAHLDLQVVAKRRARREGVPAAAGHGDLFVLGMNCVFHSCFLPCAGSTKKARSVTTRVGARKKKPAENPFRRRLPRQPAKRPAVIHKTCG